MQATDHVGRCGDTDAKNGKELHGLIFMLYLGILCIREN